jgi:hypothetical protein
MAEGKARPGLLPVFARDRRGARGTKADRVSKPIPKPIEWGDLNEEREARRLWAALVLSPRIEVCEGLIAGVPVPTRRLDQGWVSKLDLSGDVCSR